VLHARDHAVQQNADAALVRLPHVELVDLAGHARKARVVEQAVEAPEAGCGEPDQPLHVGLARDVRVDVGHPVAERLRQLGALLLLNVADDDARALLDKALHGGAADPAAPARDDGDLALETRHQRSARSGFLTWETSVESPRAT
jgi:hypothetical protein